MSIDRKEWDVLALSFVQIKHITNENNLPTLFAHS